MIILVVCLIFGFYRGFVHSVLNLGSALLSFWGSFQLFPKISDILRSNADFTQMISTYTDSTSILGDLGLSSLSVSSLSQSVIDDIVTRAGLPSPLDTILQYNLEQEVFSPLGDLATTVGEYINQTILSVCINVICFLLCFILFFVFMTIITNLVRAVFRFPLLKQLDWMLGGAFGLLLGILLCFVIFTVLPLMQSVVPLEELTTMIDESALIAFFESNSLIISIMNQEL